MQREKAQGIKRKMNRREKREDCASLSFHGFYDLPLLAIDSGLESFLGLAHLKPQPDLYPKLPTQFSRGNSLET